MIYLSPRPAEASSHLYYQHESYLPFASALAPHSPAARLYGFARALNLHWKKKMVSRFSAGKTLLDVGCGTGEFLATMRDAGWQVHGLERDPAAAEFGRTKLKLSIQTGSLTDLEAGPSAFDMVTLWHVLEHLYAPVAALEVLRRHINPAGALIIAVPNIASVDARIYRQHWIALDAPRHVNHFSLASLAQCGARAGFALRWWQQLPLDAFFNTLMSERLEAEAKKTSAWLWPLRLARAVAVASAALVAGSHNPFFSASAGATLVAVFKKNTGKE